jgi:hypothetical protein
MRPLPLHALVLSSSLCAFSSVALAACGGSVGGAPGDGTGSSGGTGTGTSGGTSGSSGTTGPHDIVGSFDLTFTSVDATGPGPSSTQPPSRTVGARLDIRKSPTSTGYDAVLTARWGQPAAYSVSVTPSAVTLNGSGAIGASTPSGYVADTWGTIVLGRDASGGLSGALTATGTENASEGDVVWNAKLTGTGAIAADATDPELRAETFGLAGSAGMLPWDDIRVRVAEPVGGDPLLASTHLSANGTSVALRIDPFEAKPESWAGETSLLAHIADWNALASAKPTLTASGAVDRVGRTAKPLAAPMTLLTPGPATSQIDFDSDVILANFWGTWTVYGGGLAGQADPRCEAGGCARLGPVTVDSCAATTSGLVAQLPRAALGHVELRYRILAQPKYPGGPMPFAYDAVTFELAATNAAATDSRTGSPTLVPLATPIDGMSYATDWTTLDVAAPGAGIIGAAVALGTASASRGGCGGPPLPPADVEVLVEYLRAK